MRIITFDSQSNNLRYKMTSTQKSPSPRIILLSEFIWIFFATPLILALDVSIGIKLTMVICALIFVIYRSLVGKIFRDSFVLDRPISPNVKRRMIVISSLLFFGGTVFVYLFDRSLLFKVVWEAPWLWVGILFVYTFLSVVPQEYLYRRFFFARYGELFSSKATLIIANVICFSFCHLFLHSPAVLILTALGGVLFAMTYSDHQDLKWVSIEHAIYGNIIFTLGIGEMLAFPMPG